jgi:hypothetical protein
MLMLILKAWFQAKAFGDGKAALIRVANAVLQRVKTAWINRRAQNTFYQA